MNLNEFFTPGVIWFLIGLGFFLLEMVIPGLIVFFFGLGAWIVSLSYVLFDPGINAQLLIFGVTSILSMLLLRKFLKHKFFNANNAESDALEDEFINKTAIAETDIPAGTPGKLSFKGTQWKVVPDVDIQKGDTVKIINKESLTLFITK